MSDVRRQPGALLYFWPRYLDDTREGPISRLNQNSAAMAEARPADTLWAFSPVGGGRYAIVARMTVARAGENPPESDERRMVHRGGTERDCLFRHSDTAGGDVTDSKPWCARRGRGSRPGLPGTRRRPAPFR
jgi:hypothetical protein